MEPNSARRRFAAALILYAAWVGALAAMAVTSAERPPSRPLPSAAGGVAPANPPPAP